MRKLKAGLLNTFRPITAATEAKRGRLFCAKSLVDILEEPARLTPAGTLPIASVPAA